MNPYLRVLLALLVIALVSGCCLSWTGSIRTDFDPEPLLKLQSAGSTDAPAD